MFIKTQGNVILNTNNILDIYRHEEEGIVATMTNEESHILFGFGADEEEFNAKVEKLQKVLDIKLDLSKSSVENELII